MRIWEHMPKTSSAGGGQGAGELLESLSDVAVRLAQDASGDDGGDTEWLRQRHTQRERKAREHRSTTDCSMGGGENREKSEDGTERESPTLRSGQATGHAAPSAWTAMPYRSTGQPGRAEAINVLDS